MEGRSASAPHARGSAALALAAAVVLAGCFLLEPESGLQDDLDVQRAAWQSHGYADYSYTMSVRCVCGGIVNVPTRVTVASDTVAALVVVSSGDPVPAEYRHWYLTVNQLFDALQAAIDGRAEVIHVAYHSDLNYPTSVAIAYSLVRLTDEVGYEVSDLVPAGSQPLTTESIDE